MNLNYLAFSFIIISFVISKFFYHQKPKEYSSEKDIRINSNTHFAFIYKYIQISTLLFSILSLLFDSPFSLKLFNSSIASESGIILMIIGTALFVISKTNLGKEYSPCFDSFIPNKIIVDGIYKYIRHPIYTANILLTTGIFLATASVWLLLNVFILVYYYYDSSNKEEMALKKYFSNYHDYSSKTGKFIPKFLKKLKEQ